MICRSCTDDMVPHRHRDSTDTGDHMVAITTTMVATDLLHRGLLITVAEVTMTAATTTATKPGVRVPKIKLARI